MNRSTRTAIVVSILFLCCYAAKKRPAEGYGVSATRMSSHVRFLVNLPSPRNYMNRESMGQAAGYIKSSLESIGIPTREQNFTVDSAEYTNVIGVIGTSLKGKLVIGAHYDVAGDQPGADDNASGIAALLEVARMLKDHEAELKYQVELVAYALEEPPFFGSDKMGSYIHAQSLKAKGEEIRGMISLEMLGCYSEEKGSQRYPLGVMKLFYPSRGNFIAAVGNMGSRRLATAFRKVMKRRGELPCVILSAPSWITGVDFSDHRNYWIFGYDAIMLTDTAFYRNRNYHEMTDTMETLDFEKMRYVVSGLINTILNGSL